MTTPDTAHSTEPRNNAHRHAFRVQRALGQLGPGPHKLDDIRLATHMKRTTVHKILQSAVAAGVARQVGHGMYELADEPGYSAIATEINAAARAALYGLAQSTGDLVTLHARLYLGSLRQMCVAVVEHDKIQPPTLIRLQDPRRLPPAPLQLGASGHAMLASLPLRLIARNLLSPLDAPTGSLWREKLADTPSRIADRGYARTVSTDGWETLASPLLSAGTVTGAIAVTFRGGGDRGTDSRSVRLRAAADIIQFHLDDATYPNTGFERSTGGKSEEVAI